MDFDKRWLRMMGSGEGSEGRRETARNKTASAREEKVPEIVESGTMGAIIQRKNNLGRIFLNAPSTRRRPCPEKRVEI